MMDQRQSLTARQSGWALLAIWVVTCVALTWIARDRIVKLEFLDTDDALRAVEMRAWRLGQSWFDVTQYRINPPYGTSMHWSRLVDLPLAGLVSLFALFAAPSVAERAAFMMVPLLTYLILLVTTYALGVQATGRRGMALVAGVMLSGLFGVMVQLLPMRIDHHGWQIALSMLAVLQLLRGQADRARGAAIAGAVMALALTISLEGLPLAVALGGVCALRFLRRPDDHRTLIAYMLSLCGGCAALLLATLSWSGARLFWCDAMSPAYLAPIAAATLCLLIGGRLGLHNTAWHRSAMLGVGAGCALAVMRLLAPQCLAGPFANLDPLVRSLWFEHVMEGMPLWRQPASLIPTVVMTPLLGLLGTGLAIQRDPPPHRARWIELLLLQLATFAASLLVVRAMGLAQALALPGMAWLFIHALGWSLQRRTALARIVLAAGCGVLLTPVAGLVVSAGISKWTSHRDSAGAATLKNTVQTPHCASSMALQGLDQLPPAVLLTPLDLGPFVMAYTHHSVIGTGHHRNHNGMKVVISAFTAPPAVAQQIVERTRANYLVVCPGTSEMALYAKHYPHSLAASLVHGQLPEWLVPIRDLPIPARVFQIGRSKPAQQ